MKKKLTALFLALTLPLSLFTASVSAKDNSDTVDIIVELDAPSGIDRNIFARICMGISELIIPELECGYIYDTLLCGFHAMLPEKHIERLESLGFVNSVYISGYYEALGSDEDMYPAKYIGFDAADEYGLSGDGVKVAVIDSGFDVNHPAFDIKVTDTVDLSVFDEKFAPQRLNAQQFGTTASSMKISSKLPFAFDYFSNDTGVSSASTHGTHVAGIIGAGKTELSHMTGIAPECQLMLMKIFDDNGSNGYDHLMIAAMEDAIKLDADIINLSLGHYAGSSDPTRTINLAAVLESASEHGCTVVAAVGNDGVSVESSQAAVTYGVPYPHASHTDYGTVSAPASCDGVLAVASADNAFSYAKYITHLENRSLLIEYSDTNKTSGVTEEAFTKLFAGQTFEYVPIPGIGKASDFDGIDLSGKLALIERGTIPFTEKVNNAAAKGAIGAIVYNNEPDSLFNMDLTGATIPAIAIYRDDAEAMMREAVHKITVNDSAVVGTRKETGGTVSDFSSRGTTPSLTLKPDITGIGGGVLSTVDGGTYDGNSGTSMASPQVSGVCALLYEQCRRNGITKKSEIREDVMITLMNSAVPILQKNGVEYSPRAQGAGLANISAAIESDISITYKENGLAKAELYDGLSDTVKFTVTVNNKSDKPQSVTLGATLTSDGYVKLKVKDRYDYFSSLESVCDRISQITANGIGNINRYSKGYKAAEILLKPYESTDVYIEMKLDSTYHKDLSQIFTSGYFAEGYIYAEADGVSVSLPYMGYIGDWTVASVTDGNAYLEEYEHFKGAKMYVEVGGTYIPTGVELYSEKQSYNSGIIAFSPNGDNSADEILLGSSILRNIKSGIMRITDENGEDVYSNEIGYITKTRDHTDSTVFYFFWDGSDGFYERYKLPDGRYTMNVEYTLDYGKDKTQSFSYGLILDTKAPVLESASYKNGKLTVNAADENGILCVKLYATNMNTPSIYVEADSNAVFDLSDYTGGDIYYEITDIAHNKTAGKLTLFHAAK